MSSEELETISVLYLVSHPIQYQVPLFRRLSADKSLMLDVLYRSDFSVNEYHDKGFNKNIEWDVNLLEGYNYKFLPKSNKLFALYKILKSGKYKILWVHGYTNLYHFYAIVLAKFLKIKVVVRAETIYEFKDNQMLKRLIRPSFMSLLSILADAFLAIGTRNADFYKRYVSDSKIYLAPYTVDNKFFQCKLEESKRMSTDFKNKLKLELDRPVILYVGKLIKRKHPDDLIRAYIKLINRKLKIKLPYLVLAGDGEMFEALKNIITAHKLEDHIKLVGFCNQQDLVNYYNMCDMFVLPASRENWGLVVNEAMNAGKPIVLSDEVGCALDLLKNNVNGIMFPVRDEEALANALYGILENEENKFLMGEKSLDIINQWGIEETALGIIRACKNILNKPINLPGQ